MTAGTIAPLVIGARFCGPPQSANGGYFCGRVAALAEGTVTVRLRVPPPLETPMQATLCDAGNPCVYVHAPDVGLTGSHAWMAIPWRSAR